MHLPSRLLQAPARPCTAHRQLQHLLSKPAEPGSSCPRQQQSAAEGRSLGQGASVAAGGQDGEEEGRPGDEPGGRLQVRAPGRPPRPRPARPPARRLLASGCSLCDARRPCISLLTRVLPYGRWRRKAQRAKEIKRNKQERTLAREALSKRWAERARPGCHVRQQQSRCWFIPSSLPGRDPTTASGRRRRAWARLGWTNSPSARARRAVALTEEACYTALRCADRKKSSPLHRQKESVLSTSLTDRKLTERKSSMPQGRP